MFGEKVKNAVKERYTGLINKSTEKSEELGNSKEMLEVIGYRKEEIQSLPEAAIGQSFGCGNPNAFLHVQPGEVVLDLGSGAGFDAIIAAKKVGTEGKVIGVDMNDSMLEVARRNILDAELFNVEFRKGDIEELPVESNTIDHIISNCVINLSPNKEKVFQEAFRVLKKGGQLVISDIVTDGFPAEMKNQMGLWAKCLAGAIEEEIYLDWIKKAGFKEVKVLDRIYFSKEQIILLAEDEQKEILPLLTGIADNEPVTTVYSLKIWAVK